MPIVQTVPDPAPGAHGAVVRVEASGLCRSDWHGWMGHDPDIQRFPHVPGHELAGVVEAVGAGVRRWRPGDRVTVPFVCACGSCPQCLAGDHQVCDRQTQPGFTHWGSFAEFTALDWADVNLVALPDSLDAEAAAALGCRFATAYRAVLQVGRVRAGEWVAVHGCGGVGLSAVMIAAAAGARVIAVDISEPALSLARQAGAELAVPAGTDVREHTDGGAHVGLDAIGSEAACAASVAGLRKRGRHVQVGLLLADERSVPVPMSRVISHELELAGVHGMAVRHYPALLDAIGAGRLEPARLVGTTVALKQAGEELAAMGGFARHGATVITRFS
jgi:D-arabinose 1-dehydrogenase-like Zn-dependent alcohol dehydrogenase